MSHNVDMSALIEHTVDAAREEYRNPIMVLMGVCGCGKTTLAEQLAQRLGWKYAEADAFHPQSNIDKMSQGIALQDEDRWGWLRSLRVWIEERRRAGEPGIVTCSALKRVYRDVLRTDGVVFVHLDGDHEAIMKLLGSREGHFMKPEMLDSQFAILERPEADEPHLTIDVARGLSPEGEADMVIEALGLQSSQTMQLGMVGLGRMGGNMAERLRRDGHEVIGFDLNPDSGRDVASLSELVARLQAPRVVWIMVPSGKPTDACVSELAELLEAGDIVVDGGNTHYLDDQRHAEQLRERGIGFIDVGTSGGVWGITEGYALMAGGESADFERVEPILRSLKPAGDSGLVHAGPVGAGHFVKMVHNGIEYGMMQAFGEGFALMEASDLVDNPAEVVASWQQGSVVRSWLLDLLVRALRDDEHLAHVAGVAQESGEAKWMVQAALGLGVPLPVTSASLYARQSSQIEDPMTMKVVSALRNQFGGHTIDKR